MSANNKGFTHEKVETNNFLLIVLTLLVVAVGGLVEIVPLFFQKSTTEAVQGVEPYEPLRLMGRDVYIREGCYNCHSQMIRPFRAETMRYGHYSVAGEFVYDHPSSGAPSVQVLTCSVWAASTAMNGTVFT